MAEFWSKTGLETRLYFDTAYVAKCYLNEPDGKAVRRLARRASGLYSSMLAIAEMACVFQWQIREGRIDVQQAAQWRGAFLDDVRGGVWVLLQVSERLLCRVEALTSACLPRRTCGPVMPSTSSPPKTAASRKSGPMTGACWTPRNTLAYAAGVSDRDRPGATVGCSGTSGSATHRIEIVTWSVLVMSPMRNWSGMPSPVGASSGTGTFT